MTFDDLKALVSLTFREPVTAARSLIAMNWPLSARWMGLFLAVSVSALLAWLSSQLFPIPEAEGMPVLSLTAQPLVLAIVQLFAIVLAASLMTGVGRIFGGRGNFDDALLLTVWIEIVLLLVQVVQLGASLILPGLSGILGVLAIVLFVWLTVQFTKALHGFTSGGKVLLGLIGTAFIAGFALSIIAASFGLLPEVPQ